MGIDISYLSGEIPEFFKHFSKDLTGPSTFGVDIWSPLLENPHPITSAKMGAPLFTACS